MINLPPSIDGLEFVQDLDWEKDIFPLWKTQEAHDPNWLDVAKSKGWNSWEAWRSFMAEQFQAKERRWRLYKVLNPIKIIPQWLVGPTQSWQNHFPENMPLWERTFRRLLEIKQDWVKGHGKINAILQDFPVNTQMIGFHFPHREDSSIMDFEGHHRSAAIALAEVLGQSIQFRGDVFVALTGFSEEDENLIPRMIERGSGKI